MPSILAVAVLVLTLVTFVLICFGFTKPGKTKAFKFLVGTFSMACVIGYSFQTALGTNGFAPVGLVLLFINAILHFSFATWMSAE